MPIEITRHGNKNDKLTKEEFKKYRGLTGQISWAAHCSRPDVNFDVRDLSTRNKSATLGDVKQANKVLKKLQSQNVEIKHKQLGNWRELKIVAFTDSSYRNAEEATKSLGGRFVGLVNKHGDCNPLVWKSRTIQQVCKSVKTAETRALNEGMEDAIYLSQLVHEIYTGKINKGHIPVEMIIDSQTLQDSIESSKPVVEKTVRHIIAWMKQQTESQTVNKISVVSSKDNIADVFTKHGVNTNQILGVIREGSIII